MGWRDRVRGVEIEPSIYAADFLRLGEQLETLLGAGVRIFHVDVGDGHFIPPVTIGPVVVESIAPLVHGAGGRIDCHLMVDDPMGQLPLIAAAGGDSASFHLETVDAPGRVVARARELGLGVGLAVNPETPVEAAAEAAEGVDLVLVMSVHPGYSGQAFLPESVERIARLRELLPTEVLIEVDGGIKPDNVANVRSAGAQLIVAASAIFYEDDIADAYRRLVQAAGG